MSWLDKLLPPKIQQTDPSQRKGIPEGLWVKCPACESVLYRTDVEANLHVCPKCDHHMRIGARARLDALLDAEGRYELGQEILPVDALKFKDTKKYPDRIKAAMDDTGETDAMVVMGGAIHALPVVVACFEFEFMGGSMGSVCGRAFHARRTDGAGAKGTVHLRVGHRWRAHAGKPAVAHADGEDDVDDPEAG